MFKIIYIIPFLLISFKSLAENLPLQVQVNALFVEEEMDFKIINFHYEITNIGDKFIKLAHHQIVISDLLGEYVNNFGLEKDLYIASGEKKDFKKKYSVLSTRIEKINFNDFVFEYMPEAYVFEDNSIMEFD